MDWSLQETTNEIAWRNRKAEETPAQKAMRYALEIYKSRQGRPPSIWISPIKNVFKEINVSYDEATETATIKNYWKN